MSYLRENSKYYVVLFNDDFIPYKHPYYSIPAYDRAGKGMLKLINNIIRKKKPAYAVIYETETKRKLRYFKNGYEVEKFNLPKEYLSLWILFNNGEKTIYKTPAVNEKQAYWFLVNNHIKIKGIRQKIKIAVIYDNENNEIGRFFKTGNDLTGQGKYHKKTPITEKE